MKFGYFNDQDKEYVITDPKTPNPWINYLGNEDFFSLISIHFSFNFQFLDPLRNPAKSHLANFQFHRDSPKGNY